MPIILYKKISLLLVFCYIVFAVLMPVAETPVALLAGIMPMTNTAQIVRSCKLSGATLPTRFRRIADKFGDNPEDFRWVTDRIDAELFGLFPFESSEGVGKEIN